MLLGWRLLDRYILAQARSLFRLRDSKQTIGFRLNSRRERLLSERRVSGQPKAALKGNNWGEKGRAGGTRVSERTISSDRGSPD